MTLDGLPWRAWPLFNCNRLLNPRSLEALIAFMAVRVILSGLVFHVAFCILSRASSRLLFLSRDNCLLTKLYHSVFLTLNSADDYTNSPRPLEMQSKTHLLH